MRRRTPPTGTTPRAERSSVKISKNDNGSTLASGRRFTWSVIVDGREECDVDTRVEARAKAKELRAALATRDEDRAIVEAALELLASAVSRHDACELCEALGAIDEVVGAYGACIRVCVPSVASLIASIDTLPVDDATIRLMMHEAGLELLEEHELAHIERTVERYALIERGARCLGVEHTDLAASIIAHQDRNLTAAARRPTTDA